MLCLTLDTYETFFLFLQKHRCNFTSVWRLRNKRSGQERPQEGCSRCRCEGTSREPEQAQQDEVAQWSCWSSGEAERLDVFNDLTPMTHKTCHSNLEPGSEIAAVLTKLLVVHVQNVISSFIGYLIRGAKQGCVQMKSQRVIWLKSQHISALISTICNYCVGFWKGIQTITS